MQISVRFMKFSIRTFKPTLSSVRLLNLPSEWRTLNQRYKLKKYLQSTKLSTRQPSPRLSLPHSHLTFLSLPHSHLTFWCSIFLSDLTKSGYVSTLRNNVRSRAWGAAIGCSYRVEHCCIMKKCSLQCRNVSTCRSIEREGTK
ncbi:uncharacterized protein LOC125493406 [Beta vulgaris subsp. vulgaris]|uniref:uncharacterized protein LOC125493406 n=1 Tax=Beta vulgaris subsp. vulgaris TaxID=3555 RepID=UPI002547B904|nr:uncharacterized protein LOC125493406 [Beta vulgaris subsp. vulgaris]